ncbi:hypothetical protein SAMN06265348_106184 [Pedobacter westerhofensis]|uniref:MazG-like protein n=1 Tax=Pedobacter westerhofensis TaxID=425512 RepID=A0A521DUE2_9SPHI|nr:MazG-like protein [Pedobacter westerhofensis]SMO75265.1 hypothetical protein SAMN06265348_106184 [Pedobacter westerhofensis]
MSNTLKLNDVISRAEQIRELYHQLELAHHGSEWTVEEDVLAFLTDAALIARLTMSQQGRWPKENTEEELSHKLGECIWWLIIIANRTGLDINAALDGFLTKTEKLLNK